jgi:hypothetical protein
MSSNIEPTPAPRAPIIIPDDPEKMGAVQDWPTDGRNAMAIMSMQGDTKVIWDPQKPDEIEVAKETFNKLKKKGYAAFSVSDDGSKGEQIREFDPKAGRIIMAAPMVGG